MDNLYYLPISLVENVLFEKPINGIALIDFEGNQHLLNFSNIELQKYYEHYFIEIQRNAHGMNEVGDDYKIPIGIEILSNDEGLKLMPFEDFQKEFDATHLSKIDSIILNFNGEDKEFIIVQLAKKMLEEAAFNNNEISIDLGKWKIKISNFMIPIILSSLSQADKKAILTYEEKDDSLELFGLLLEPDFDSPDRRQLTIKKI
jgi:hypothetical protein